MVVRSLKRFKGLHDYNTPLPSFPLQMDTESRILRNQVCPQLAQQKDEEKEDDDEQGEIRRTELALIPPERMAILQLGVSSFFAIAALLRSL